MKFFDPWDYENGRERPERTKLASAVYIYRRI